MTRSDGQGLEDTVFREEVGPEAPHVVEDHAYSFGQAIPRERDQAHHILAVSALGGEALPAVHPGFEQTGYGKIELLDPLEDAWRQRVGQDGRPLSMVSFDG